MEEEKTLNTAETDTPSEEPKGKKEKAPKESKADKQAAKDAKKKKAQLQKEWENSIVTSKRVKREEMRRKLKRAMLFMLVVALIITSVVYIMLLFLDENNMRITASSNNNGKRISLSLDSEFWSPYLNGKGPKNMLDISYNRGYGKEEIPYVNELYDMLSSPDDFEPGNKQKEHYICFAFMLRNDGDEDVILQCEMTLEYDKVRNLQDCVRVMWGTSTKNHPELTQVKIFATLSDNFKLYGTDINKFRDPEEGFIEYVAYPSGSDATEYDLVEKEREIFASSGDEYYNYYLNGYFSTEPFYSDEYVFNYEDGLEAGDIMYCYIVIWLEGSDFDCVDSALGGYVKMDINFTAS